MVPGRSTAALDLDLDHGDLLRADLVCHIVRVIDEAAEQDTRAKGDAGRRRRRHRFLKWILGAVATLVVLIGVAVVVFFWATRNPEPGAFYTPPDDRDAALGTILRSEPFTAGIPAGAGAWKVLYVSTDEHDDPLAVSGLIIAPSDAGPGPHPVLAWSHGTSGIARPCAPSNTPEPLKGVPDMTGPLDQGWVIALTDYPGLGTPGPHPYLVGESEGRAVLDSVRAVHALDDEVGLGLELDDRYVIWGHSQGGQGALFAGQLAADYLSDQSLVGVAALAPATTLQDNLEAIMGTPGGNILTILAVESWSEYYPDISADTLTDAAQRPAERIADACFDQPSRYRIVVDDLELPDDMLAIDPTTDPRWTARLAQNSPEPGGITVPVFVGQGLADEIIAPKVTEAWTSQRCDAGAPTVWRTYPDVNHNGVVGPGGADALSWTIDRFADLAVTSTCPS